jgi:hypothetical protein
MGMGQRWSSSAPCGIRAHGTRSLTDRRVDGAGFALLDHRPRIPPPVPNPAHAARKPPPVVKLSPRTAARDVPRGTPGRDPPIQTTARRRRHRRAVRQILVFQPLCSYRCDMPKASSVAGRSASRCSPKITPRDRFMTRLHTVEPVLVSLGTIGLFVLGIGAVLIAWLFTA